MIGFTVAVHILQSLFCGQRLSVESRQEIGVIGTDLRRIRIKGPGMWRGKEGRWEGFIIIDDIVNNSVCVI